MAGVTDLPFRQLCRQHGAALAVSEMVIADPSFWKTRKSRHRLDHAGETAPISVQIAGGDAEMLANAARLNQDRGAQIIDINMGCPAKKVCNKAAGSALMKDERLVTDILESVVSAVDIPVTLKIRTGWDKHNKNALAIAKIAERSGIQALAVHGRTRACGYSGEAEYESITAIKQAVTIPVLANGDINSPEKAAATQFMIQGALQQHLGSRVGIEEVAAEALGARLIIKIAYSLASTDELITQSFEREGPV